MFIKNVDISECKSGFNLNPLAFDLCEKEYIDKFSSFLQGVLKAKSVIINNNNTKKVREKSVQCLRISKTK